MIGGGLMDDVISVLIVLTILLMWAPLFWIHADLRHLNMRRNNYIYAMLEKDSPPK